MTCEDLALRIGQPDALIVQVTAEARYAAGHIEGAVLVTPNELVSGVPPAAGQLPDRERLQRLFGRIGLTRDVEVIAYDDEGGGWAGRLLWTLDVIGHARWSYLDGGLHAWLGEGRSLSTTDVERPPSELDITIDRAPIAEVSDIVSRLDDPSLTIWDCRSEAEYLGTRSGSQRAGHIPGARHLDWLDLMDPARQLRLRSDLPGILERAGIRTDSDIITHCQTHHRSGLSYLVARLLGLPRIRAYHGSWAEWGNRSDTPIATGR
ncbi:MAG: sulfurtransferase [Gammaproteobacteria bacterium]|nr:sulfurtransferase [Gammaproteobacteria bacterium]